MFLFYYESKIKIFFFFGGGGGGGAGKRGGGWGGVLSDSFIHKIQI